jgi:hypothetical protein
MLDAVAADELQSVDVGVVESKTERKTETVGQRVIGRGDGQFVRVNLVESDSAGEEPPR